MRYIFILSIMWFATVAKAQVTIERCPRMENDEAFSVMYNEMPRDANYNSHAARDGSIFYGTDEKKLAKFNKWLDSYIKRILPENIEEIFKKIRLHKDDSGLRIFFSGHLIFDMEGKVRFARLVYSEPYLNALSEEKFLQIHQTMMNENIQLWKSVNFSEEKDLEEMVKAQVAAKGNFCVPLIIDFQQYFEDKLQKK